MVRYVRPRFYLLSYSAIVFMTTAVASLAHGGGLIADVSLGLHRTIYGVLCDLGPIPSLRRQLIVLRLTSATLVSNAERNFFLGFADVRTAILPPIWSSLRHFPVSNGVKHGRTLAPTLVRISPRSIDDCAEDVYLHMRADGNVFSIVRLCTESKVREVLIREKLFDDDVTRHGGHFQSLADRMKKANIMA